LISLNLPSIKDETRNTNEHSFFVHVLVKLYAWLLYFVKERNGALFDSIEARAVFQVSSRIQPSDEFSFDIPFFYQIQEEVSLTVSHGDLFCSCITFGCIDETKTISFDERTASAKCISVDGNRGDQ
jgi:hypothetical protein